MSSALKVRVLSALVLAPSAVAIILLGGWAYAVLIILALAIALHEWWGMAKAGDRLIFVLLFGILYLTLAAISFFVLRFWFETGAWYAVLALLVVAASDTGAYFTGKTIGGPKLAPLLSPKKTWAGLAGAMFWAGLTLALLVFFEQNFGFTSTLGFLPLAYVFVIGCCFGLTGQAGDLLISYFKRRSGLKDTGHLIPGHGGLLDRIDSLLLVCPVFVVILALL